MFKQARKVLGACGLGLVLAAYAGADANAFGELTYMPGYQFVSNSFNPYNLGLFVWEEVTGPWFYTSWSGTGRTFLNDPNLDHVTWLSTEHDINYRIIDRLTVGLGGGYQLAYPTHNSDADMHMRIGVKLW